MMRTLATVLIVYCITLGVHAGEDMRLAIKRIDFSVDSNNAAVVELAYTLDEKYVYGDTRLKGLHLVWNGQKMTVPERDLKEITKPQVTTLDMREGVYFGGVNSNRMYRCIRLRFGDPVTQQESRMEACFLFWGGEYKKLSIQVPIDPRREEGSVRSLVGLFIDREAHDDAFTHGDEKFKTLQEFLKKKGIGPVNHAPEGTARKLADPQR